MPSITGVGRAVLDGPSLHRLRTVLGEERALREILQEFLTSSRQLVREMHLSLARSRPRDVERTAHTLKSMARLIGAKELAEACRVVEFTAHGEAPPPVPAQLVAQVDVRLQEAQGAVERLLR